MLAVFFELVGLTIYNYCHLAYGLETKIFVVRVIAKRTQSQSIFISKTNQNLRAVGGGGGGGGGGLPSMMIVFATRFSLLSYFVQSFKPAAENYTLVLGCIVVQTITYSTVGLCTLCWWQSVFCPYFIHSSTAWISFKFVCVEANYR